MILGGVFDMENWSLTNIVNIDIILIPTILVGVKIFFLKVMKFSTKTTYGLRAMIELARDYKKNESVSLAKISKKERISLRYLERLFASLKKADLVESEIGKSGGYRLIRDPKKIEVFDIIKALEGKLEPFHCVTETGKIICSKECKCGATKVLISVQAAINKTLKQIKLSELL